MHPLFTEYQGDKTANPANRHARHWAAE